MRIDLYFENLRFFLPIDLAQTILLNSFGPGKKIIQIRWILIFGMIGKFRKQKFEVLVRVQVVGLGGLNETVENSTGLCTFRSIDDYEIFRPRVKGRMACSAKLLSMGTLPSERKTRR